MASKGSSRTGALGIRGALGTGEGLAGTALVAALFAASLFLAYSGAWFAQYFMEKGPSFERLATIRDGMFRWDSHYYYSIATEGYRYDGDPCREQNVVFMPAFPLLVRGISGLSGLDVVSTGFLVVRVSLLVALLVLFHWVRGQSGPAAGAFVVGGLLFSPGSFAFHAWYSESVMLLFLALALAFHSRGRYLAMAVAAGLLGASRVGALPFSAVFAGVCLRRAWQGFRGGGAGRAAALDLLAAALCLSGAAAWLWHLGSRFGNPFELIAAIKYCAWGKVHERMGPIEFLTLAPLLEHVKGALARPYFFALDIKAMNLIWTLAALAASVWALVRRRLDPVALGFAGYFALTFYANGKSEWLESSIRYYAPMFTIYLLAHDIWATLRQRLPAVLVDGAFGALFAVQAAYMVLYQALFTVQRWHYF